jgi:hypothetical protein
VRFGRLHIATFVVIAASVWLIALLCQGTPVAWAHAQPFTIVVSVLVALGLLLERVLWHQRWLHGWFVKRPDLRGTWRVEIRSDQIGPDTDGGALMIVGYVGVVQTLSTLRMHLMTSESESHFIADHVRPSPNGSGYQVIGVYMNEPRIHLRVARISEMHHGAIVAETHGPAYRPTTLTAKYWTDRRTSGTMELTARIDHVSTRYDDAQRIFSALAVA